MTNSDSDFYDTHWWLAGNYGDTLANTMYPPNPGADGLHDDIYANGDGASRFLISASSEHPGGVNYLFADGSVRFIKNSINSWQLDASNGYVPMGLNYTVLSNDGYGDTFGTFSVKPGFQFGVYQALSTRNGGEIISADAY